MYNDRGQRIVRRQRLAAANVLKIESQSIRHPEGSLSRSAIAAAGKQWAVRAADANLDGLHARGHPTDGGHTEESGARDRYGIRTGGQRRWRRGWARRINGGETDVGLKRIRAGGRQVPNVEAVAGRVV